MPRPRNSKRTFEFTDSRLKKLPFPVGGEEKQRDYFDTKERGLGLRLGYAGKRTWFVMYSGCDGRRKRLTLGEYGRIEDGRLSLAVARKRAKVKLGQVATGKDPASELAELRRAPTVRHLASDFIVEQKKHRKSWQRQERILDRDILPVLGELKARHVRRADVRAMLKAIAERPAPVLANRAHEVVRRMYNFAIDEELYGVEFNPAERIKRFQERPRDRWLTQGEIGAYWRELEQEPIRAAAALRLLLVTAQRQQNVLAMRWDQIDWKERIWICPSNETKTGETYIIPLSSLAMDILEKLNENGDSKSAGGRNAFKNAWVFKKRGDDGPADRTFIAKPHRRACERAGIVDYTVHDHRHTFSTHTARMGISEFIRGRVMHHSPGRTITGKYTHHDWHQEKQDALEEWAVEISGIIAENILRFGREERFGFGSG